MAMAFMLIFTSDAFDRCWYLMKLGMAMAARMPRQGTAQTRTMTRMMMPDMPPPALGTTSTFSQAHLNVSPGLRCPTSCRALHFGHSRITGFSLGFQAMGVMPSLFCCSA